MAMNWYHRWLCASGGWARSVADQMLPWALDGVDLGPEVLEVGPGYGATTRVLAERVPRLTAVEIDPKLAGRLRRLVDGQVPEQRRQALRSDQDQRRQALRSNPEQRREATRPVRVLVGDGTALPLPDGTFTGVTCHTMLHHVPAPELQDRLFAEAYRVLRPGGVFAGSDSQLSLRFRLIHLGDTMVVVDPATLPARLDAAGFHDISVDTIPGRRVRFRAVR